MRELISPLLISAAALAGGMKVLAKFDVCGTRARGKLDWGVLYRNFSIVVVEVRIIQGWEKRASQLAFTQCVCSLA